MSEHGSVCEECGTPVPFWNRDLTVVTKGRDRHGRCPNWATGEFSTKGETQ